MSHFVASLPLDLVAKQMADALIEHAWWSLALTTGSHSWYDDHISLLPLRTNYCPADFAPECTSEADIMSLGDRLRNDVRYAPTRSG